MDEHDTQDGPVPLILGSSPRGKGVGSLCRSYILSALSAYEGLIELHDPKAASSVVILRMLGRRFDA